MTTATAKKNAEVPCWDYLAREAATVFRMTKEESAALRQGITAQIIAAIPFAAGCENPERTAILHLCAYVAELRGFQTFCSHLPGDDGDIMSRLSPIAHFEGGDADVIHHGMTMLALIMLEGYNASRAKDFADRTYNPLNSGAWNYGQLKTFLTAELSQMEVPLLDGLYYSVPVTTLYWKN